MCNKLQHWKRPLEDGALSTNGEVLAEGLLSKDEVEGKTSRKPQDCGVKGDGGGEKGVTKN